MSRENLRIVAFGGQQYIGEINIEEGKITISKAYLMKELDQKWKNVDEYVIAEIKGNLDIVHISANAPYSVSNLSKDALISFSMADAKMQRAKDESIPNLIVSQYEKLK